LFLYFTDWIPHFVIDHKANHKFGFSFQIAIAIKKS